MRSTTRCTKPLAPLSPIGRRRRSSRDQVIEGERRSIIRREEEEEEEEEEEGEEKDKYKIASPSKSSSKSSRSSPAGTYGRSPIQSPAKARAQEQDELDRIAIDCLNNATFFASASNLIEQNQTNSGSRGRTGETR